MQGGWGMLTGKIQVDPDRRYTIGETAEILGICRKTLWKYTRSRDIRFELHAPTKKKYYLGREIQNFFNKCV